MARKGRKITTWEFSHGAFRIKVPVYLLDSMFYVTIEDPAVSECDSDLKVLERRAYTKFRDGLEIHWTPVLVISTICDLKNIESETAIDDDDSRSNGELNLQVRWERFAVGEKDDVKLHREFDYVDSSGKACYGGIRRGAPKVAGYDWNDDLTTTITLEDTPKNRKAMDSIASMVQKIGDQLAWAISTQHDDAITNLAADGFNPQST
jgi:hypothetical protein